MDRNRFFKAILPYKYLWLFCSIFLIIDLIGFSFIKVINKNHQSKLYELQRQYTTTRQNKSRLAERNRIIHLYLNANEDLEVFRKALPEMATIADQAKILDETIDKHDLFVNKMYFKPEDSGTLSLWKYTTSLTIDGQYSKLKACLADIQSLPGLFCIESLSLKRPENNGPVNMTLNIATYCR